MSHLDQQTADMLPLLKRAGVVVVVKMDGKIIFREKRTGRSLNGIELKRKLSK